MTSNSLSLAIVPSSFVLSFAGYKPGVCKHNTVVITTLHVLFAPVPICLILVGMALFYFYPINEKRRQEIRSALEEAAWVEFSFIYDIIYDGRTGEFLSLHRMSVFGIHECIREHCSFTLTASNTFSGIHSTDNSYHS